MCSHFDIGTFLSCVCDDHFAVLHSYDTGEHQMFIRVFVVHHKQTAITTVIQRNETDKIVIVSKLPLLRSFGLVQRIKFRGIGEDLVTPSHQNVGVIAVCHVMIGIDPSLHLREIENGRCLSFCFSSSK